MDVKDDVKDGRRRTAREDAGIRNRAMLSMLSALGSVVVVSTLCLEASPCPGALVCVELADAARELCGNITETYKTNSLFVYEYIGKIFIIIVKRQSRSPVNYHVW